MAIRDITNLPDLKNHPVPKLAPIAMRYAKRLRLQDWDIEIEYVRGNTLEEGTEAQVDWDLIYRKAHIEVVHPIDLRPTTLRYSSIEEAVAHETTHILLAKLEEYLPKKDAEGVRAQNELEQIVIVLGKALLPFDTKDRLDQKSKADRKKTHA